MIRGDAKNVLRAAESMRAKSQDVLAGFALEVAETMEEKAVERTPVDTGAMKTKWRVSSSGDLSAVVENQAIYASFVEFGRRNRFGGRFVPGQKFMTTAMMETEEKLPTLVKERLKDKLGEVFG